MGHSHSSSHKRLRSLSSSKNCGEFTEIVDLEFSDGGPLSETPKLPEITNPNMTANIKEQYPKDLLVLEQHVKALELSIEKLSADEFFVRFPTLKDDLHNCWQKVYEIREPNLETKAKKYEVIDHIRELLRTLNSRLQGRSF